jgi:hypothetical protein
MRISEIIFREPNEADRAHPPFDLSPPQSSDPLTNLANAFTRGGVVKRLWNLDGSGSQPSGPVPPNPEPESVDEDPPVCQHRLIPFPQYRGSRD